MIIYCVDSDDPQEVFDNSGTKVYFSLYQEAIVDYNERLVHGDHNCIWMYKLDVTRFSTIDLLNRRNFVRELKLIEECNAYEDQD